MTNSDMRSYARFARDLLQTVADGIGKLEHNADRLPAMLPPQLSRRLPRSLGGRRHHGTGLGTKLLVAGVAVSTAALIYSRVQSNRRHSAWNNVGSGSATS